MDEWYSGGDACGSSPCMYGGTCESDGTSYRCLCTAGYTGHHCEMGEMLYITTLSHYKFVRPCLVYNYMCAF